MRPFGNRCWSHPDGSVRWVIDLHTHSDRSDGSETPERIVELAHEVGCSAVALTDHDTLVGLPRARSRADALGIRLVPGCEISCVPIAGGGVHVLVYFVDDITSPLGLELDRLRVDRRTRNHALAGRLQELGIPVTVEMAAAHLGQAPERAASSWSSTRSGTLRSPVPVPTWRSGLEAPWKSEPPVGTSPNRRARLAVSVRWRGEYRP
jgi:predicted metal-dependent phosphoesterase TrpH